MRATRPGRLLPSLLLAAAAAIIMPAVIAGGCGTSGALSEAATAGGAEGWECETLLAERYDDLFPDDRVQTVHIVMDDGDWQSMKSTVRAKEYYRADIVIDGELVEDVAVRTKGSSSLMMSADLSEFRTGLKVDLNFFNSSRSYHGLKKIVYNNGFSDPTLMREFLGYELMAAMGLPTPRACFVDLWVNDEHLGVYTQVEAVDATFLADRFDDSGGNLYKPEIKAGGLDWTEADVQAEAERGVGPAAAAVGGSVNLGGGDLADIIERLGDDAGWIPGWTGAEDALGATASGDGAGMPQVLGGGIGPGAFSDRDSDYLSSVGLRTNEDSPDYSGLYELLQMLASEPAEVSAEELAEVLEVDEVLRYLAVSVALVHLDNYIGMGHNYYLYQDGGRFWIIPWDLNMAFGGFSSGLSEERILDYYIDEPTAGSMDQYPLVEHLLDEPEYLRTYRDYLQQIVDGPFSVERMTARIQEIADVIRPYVEADERKFFSTEDFEQGLTQDLASAVANMRTPGGSFIGLTLFVEQRIASIEAQLSGASPASEGDGSGNGGMKGLAGAGLRPQAGGLPGGAPGQQDRPGGVPDGARPPEGAMPDGAAPGRTPPGGG